MEIRPDLGAKFSGSNFCGVMIMYDRVYYIFLHIVCSYIMWKHLSFTSISGSRIFG
jgi:hypothetical protein